MRLMLDNGPLGLLAAVLREGGSRSGGALHVADIVAWEGRTGHLTQRLLEVLDDGDRPWITQHSLELGSPAQRMELGPTRVIAPFDCWRSLLADGHIDAATCRDLDARTSRAMGLLGPPSRLGS